MREELRCLPAECLLAVEGASEDRRFDCGSSPTDLGVFASVKVGLETHLERLSTVSGDVDGETGRVSFGGGV